MLSYRPIVVSMLLSFAQFAHSAELDAERIGLVVESQWFQTESPGGLISNFPTLPRTELVRQMGELRAELQNRKASLAVEEEQGRFDAKDAVITLVMPGGLLYAAYRQQRHHRIAAHEQQVSSELEELQADLVAFRAIAADTLVASAQ